MGTYCTWRRRVVFRWMATCTTAVLCLTACNRNSDVTTSYTKAINAYYQDHPSCLWSEPVRFPAPPDSTEALAQDSALAGESLLQREMPSPALRVATAPEEPAFDLSAAGRSAWVTDAKDPGYGNLCYGNRKVLAIDSATPTTPTVGATTAVVYRYTVTGVPEWAKSEAVEAAFHGMQADLTGRQVGRATLEYTPHGWVVKDAPWAHIDDSDIYR